jgi:signal transduction histidine kinase
VGGTEILVSTVGGSPKTVTGILWALQNRGIPIAEVHLICTSGSGDIPDEVKKSFGRIEWYYHRIRATDILTKSAAIEAMGNIFSLIDGLKRRPDVSKLHLDLTGGRKPMSAYLTLAAEIFCDEEDNLYHVEALDPELRNPSSPKWIPEKEGDINLLEVPYVRLNFLKTISRNWGFEIDPMKPENTLREMAEILNSLAFLGFGVSVLVHEIGREIGNLRIKTHLLNIQDLEESLNNLSSTIEMVRLFLPESEIEEFQTLNLKELINRSFERIGLEKRRGVNLTIKGDEMVLEGNRDLLERVFRNLFENSIEANSNKIEVEIKDGKILISDNGKGIPEEVLENIWKPTKEGKRGMGIGLVLVRKILEKHNASISLIRSSKEGTTFEIKMELKR